MKARFLVNSSPMSLSFMPPSLPTASTAARLRSSVQK